MKTMLNDRNWIDYLFSFFESNKDKVTAILDASSCRELWIQGELFLYSNGLIRPNSGDFYGRRVDLHGKMDGFPEMIAEVKIVGYQGYSCSDIFGHGGTAYLKSWLDLNDRHYTQPTEFHDKELAHSIYKDYKKLSGIRLKSPRKGFGKSFSGEKLLILLIPHRETSAASRGNRVDLNMKQILQEVEFNSESKSKSRDFDKQNFTVRIWQI